jgi:hypothetical protein
LKRRDVTPRHTLAGSAIHHVSSLFWAIFYRMLQMRRARPDATSAVVDAAAVTALAAAVDLKLAPQRLTPGFEHHLSRRSLVLVYGGFAVGLALVGVLSARGR